MSGTLAYSAQDLELLHYYCVDANASLAYSVGLRHEEGLFTLPKFAFRYNFVLRAILALAALHRNFMQDQRQASEIDYANIAAEHVNNALPEYKLALQAVTEENCTALLMFSSLLTIYILAMSRNGLNPFHQSRRETGHDADIPSLELVSWLRLIIGGMTAIKPWIVHILSDAEFGPYLNSELWTLKLVPETAAQRQRDKILADLERLWSVTNMSPAADHAEGHVSSHIPVMTDLCTEARVTLSKTLASLRKTYLWVTFRTDVKLRSVSHHSSSADYDPPASSSALRTSLPLFVTSAVNSATSTPYSEQAKPSNAQAIELGAILSFLHTLTDDFLMLLHLRHPFALILMAHYAVLIQQKDVWWMRGLGEDMLTWVIDKLSELSPEPKPGYPDKKNPHLCYKNTAGNSWLDWIKWPRIVSENIS